MPTSHPALSKNSAARSNAATHRANTAVHVGDLLREWRSARRLSQLDLALQAGVSTRHLSCVETGKAQPSRELLNMLASSLDMPLRERNALFMAAGYAPQYTENSLDTPALSQVRHAIDLILKQQEPYPAFVINRHWDVVQANDGMARMLNFLRDGKVHSNIVRQIFDPNDLRANVVNWEEVALDLIRHLHEAVAAAPSDLKAKALLDEALKFPGVPSEWQFRELGAMPPPLLTVIFRKGDREIRLFSTITTLGTPRDVTLDELRIESCFPADEATAEFFKQLA